MTVTYTFNPIGAVYTYDPAIVLFLSVFIMAVLLVLSGCVEGKKGPVLFYAGACITAICAVAFWPHKVPVPYTKVTAEYVGVKSTNSATYRGELVMYKLPTGEVVMLPASTGLSYPPYAALYRNEVGE